jgi:hypothetical protein
MVLLRVYNVCDGAFQEGASVYEVVCKCARRHAVVCVYEIKRANIRKAKSVVRYWERVCEVCGGLVSVFVCDLCVRWFCDVCVWLLLAGIASYFVFDVVDSFLVCSFSFSFSSSFSFSFSVPVRSRAFLCVLGSRSWFSFGPVLVLIWFSFGSRAVEQGKRPSLVLSGVLSVPIRGSSV